MHVRSEIKRASDLYSTYTSARCSARGSSRRWCVLVGVRLTRHQPSAQTFQTFKKALTSDTFFSHLDAGARRTLKI